MKYKQKCFVFYKVYGCTGYRNFSVTVKCYRHNAAVFVSREKNDEVTRRTLAYYYPSGEQHPHCNFQPLQFVFLIPFRHFIASSCVIVLAVKFSKLLDSFLVNLTFLL